MPSKALIESANRQLVVRHAAEFGLKATTQGVEVRQIRDRKRTLIADFAGYRQGQLEDGRFVLHRGRASFVDAHTVEVQPRDGSAGFAVRARSFMIATGSEVSVPPVPGLVEAGFWTSDEVLDAAFRRCGVLRVEGIEELFDLAEVLSKQRRRPAGPRLAILTNAGGPGVLATDALVRSGGQLAELSPSTQEALETVLPPHWSHGNPIDILGDADPERYGQAIAAALADPPSDGLLVVLTPQAMTDPTATAQRLVSLAAGSRKPVLASACRLAD
jgi:hypothetical protein